MISKLNTIIFGNIPFSCESSLSLEESIIRLQKATARSAFSSLTEENAVGKVTETSVRLQRLIPFFGNSFKPIFVGKFHQENGKVYLKGKFTTFMFSKIFMTLWLGFAAFWTLMVILYLSVILVVEPQYFKIEPILIAFPIAGLALFFFGIILVKTGWRLSSGDIDYLKNVISSALTEHP